MAASKGEELLKAVSLRDLDEVKRLLDEGADVNYKDAKGLTPLWRAVSFPSYSEVIPKTVAEATKLKEKMKNAQVPIIQLLLEKGADPNCRGEAHGFDWPLIIKAVADSTPEVVETLLGSYKLNPNNYGRGHGPPWTALHYAITFDKLDMLRLLVNRHGIDLDIIGPDGHTPLQWAAWKGKSELCKILIDAGAKKEAGSRATYWEKGGITALMYACRNGYLDTVKTLIEGKCKTETKDANGNTALHWATFLDINNAVGLISYLLSKKAKVDAQNNDKMTPLMTACRGRNAHAWKVRELLEGGANVNKRDAHALDALWYACNGCQSNEIIELLIKAGADYTPAFPFTNKDGTKTRKSIIELANQEPPFFCASVTAALKKIDSQRNMLAANVFKRGMNAAPESVLHENVMSHIMSYLPKPSENQAKRLKQTADFEAAIIASRAKAAPSAIANAGAGSITRKNRKGGSRKRRLSK